MRLDLDASFTVARWHDAPVRAHWTLLVALLALALAGAGPAAVALAGSVLAHELGHAWAARRLGAEVLAIDLWPVGGLCVCQGVRSPVDRSLVSLAGPASNLLLFAIAQATLSHGSRRLPPELQAAASIVGAVNLGLASFNMVPIHPLDGSQAWRLPARWWRARAERGAVAEPRVHRAGATRRGALRAVRPENE